MYSDLLDAKGRKRASIFYKAAFYDRRADLSISSRFRVTTDWEAEQSQRMAVGLVLDQNEPIYRTNPQPLPEGYEGESKMRSAVVRQAEDWLDHNYPDWRNPGAYWD